MVESAAMPTIASAEDLQRFLDKCAADPGQWKILSKHATLNAAKIKVVKIKRGEMSNTLKRAMDRGEVEVKATMDEQNGPIVQVKWIDTVEVVGAYLGSH